MMTGKNIRGVLEAAPFCPFDLHVNGLSVRVEHPEQVFFAQKETTLVIDLPGHIRIIDIDHINGIDVIKRRSSGSRSASGPK
jgi:hypothetical protein